MGRKQWFRASIACVAFTCMLAAPGFQAEAQGKGQAKADPDPFTVANYPVDAVADNAVEAQQLALADGRRAALHSLFKRLVPVAAYGRLSKLRDVDPAPLISRVSVRSARNSATEYVASLDFVFDPKAVKDILRQRGFPYVEEQAQSTLIVPVVVAADPARAGSLGVMSGPQARAWSAAWNDLDLRNSLAPLQPVSVKAGIGSVAINAARSGDPKLLTILATNYQAARIVLAIAEPDANKRELKVTLAGQDAIGPFTLNRAYTYRTGELDYTLELAAVIGLGVLEGRWKSDQAAPAAYGSSVGEAPVPVQLFVEFNSMNQWRRVREMIAGTSGVEDFQIGGLSARGADVALRFPGGGQGLASALANRGISLREDGGIWVARANF